MVIASVLTAISLSLVAVVRYLRAARAARAAEQAAERDRDHLNRTFAYQTGRGLRP